MPDTPSRHTARKPDDAEQQRDSLTHRPHPDATPPDETQLDEPGPEADDEASDSPSIPEGQPVHDEPPTQPAP